MIAFHAVFTLQFFSFTDCPICYNVVQDHVNAIRRKLHELRLIIENIGDNPQAINDTDFKRQMNIVNTLVVKLLQDARRFSGKLYYQILRVTTSLFFPV